MMNIDGLFSPIHFPKDLIRVHNSEMHSFLSSNESEWTPTCKSLLATDHKEFYRSCILLKYSFQQHIFMFVLESVVLGVICALGVVGNMLSITVLLVESHASQSPSIILRLLCFSDSLFLITYFLYSSLRHIYPVTSYLSSYHDLYPYLVPYLWPIAMTIQMTVNWLVVLVTLERYCALKHPFIAKKCFTNGYLKVIALSSILVSVVFNIPRFYEWSIVEFKIDPCFNYTVVRAENSDLRENTLYSILYRSISYTILVALGPLLSVAYMNLIFMNVSIRSSNVTSSNHKNQTPNIPNYQRVHHESDPSDPSHYGRYLQEKNRSVNRLIILLVSFFIICEIPALVHQFLAVFVTRMSHDSPMIYTVSLSNALVTLKSSSNFLIYCLGGKKFRFTLRRLCRRQKRRYIPHSLLAILRRLQHPSMGNSGQNRFELVLNRRRCIDHGNPNV